MCLHPWVIHIVHPSRDRVKWSQPWSPITLCTCMCMYVCVLYVDECICMWKCTVSMNVYVPACEEERLVVECLPWLLFTLFWIQVLSLNWSFYVVYIDWPVSLSNNTHVILKIKRPISMPTSSCGPGYPYSVPHACVGSTLLPESSPPPL